MAPSFSVRGPLWIITWMEGDLRTKGRVHLGSSRTGLSDAVAHASELSQPGVNARDPKLAMGREGAPWIVWGEFGKELGVRFAALACPP